MKTINNIANFVRAFSTAMNVNNYLEAIVVDDLEKVDIKGDRESFYAQMIKEENGVTNLWLPKTRYLLRGFTGIHHIRVIPEDWSAILQSTACQLSGKVNLCFMEDYPFFSGGNCCPHTELFKEMADIMSGYVSKTGDSEKFVLVQHKDSEQTEYHSLPHLYRLCTDDGTEFSVLRCEKNKDVIEKICCDSKSWDFKVEMRVRFTKVPLSIDGKSCILNYRMATDLNQRMLLPFERLSDTDLNQEMQVVSYDPEDGVTDPTKYFNSLDRKSRNRTVRGKKYKTKNDKKTVVKSKQKKQNETTSKKDRKAARHGVTS